MSFSRHSSTENLGGGRRSWSSGSNSSSSRSWPVKSSMGLMSWNVSARPRSRNHWNESRWMEMRSGRGRTSSRLANEKRSRAGDAVAELAKAYSWLRAEGGAAEARAVKDKIAQSRDGGTTATHQHRPAMTEAQPLLERGQGARY